MTKCYRSVQSMPINQQLNRVIHIYNSIIITITYHIDRYYLSIDLRLMMMINDDDEKDDEKLCCMINNCIEGESS